MRLSGYTRWSFVVSIPLLLSSLAHATRHNGDYLNKVTTKLQTPHVVRAKPYARGPLKVLFVVPRTIAPREIVELAQRFDIQFEAFTIAHSGLLSFESDSGAAPYDLAVEGTSIREKTEEILGKLKQDYDAYVFANASLDVLPKEAQYRILKKVSEGAGLVFTYGRLTKLPIFKKPIIDDRDYVFSGVPIWRLRSIMTDFVKNAVESSGKQTADQLLEKLVETYQFKQGRVAVINYGVGSGTYYGGHGLTPPEPYSLNWQANYECYLSLVMKALLWTVPSKQPEIRFFNLANASQYQREDRIVLPAPNELGIHCSRPGGFSGKLRVMVRDETNAVEFEKEISVTLKTGDNVLPNPSPQLRLKAGGHYEDFILLSNKGTEDWGSVWFESPRDEQYVLIAFDTDKEFYEKGDKARVSAEVLRPATADTALRVSFTDTLGRLYAHYYKAIPEGKTRVSFDFPLEGSRTIATRVHGELVVNNEVVEAKDRIIFIPRRDSDEFRSILWGGLGCGNTGLGWIAYQRLRKAGFNAILSHPSADGSQERMLALCDFPLVSYSYRVMGGADDKGWRKDQWGDLKKIEDGCFYNPEIQQAARQQVLERNKEAMPYGPCLYTLGDENYFDYNSGYSPYGQRAFREYLKKHYATLVSLNREWDANYADWSQVELLPDEEAKQRGLWPMIHEHKAFNESEYADYHHFLAKAIKEADPHAKVGAEGSVPGDLEKTVEGLEIWGPYSDKRGNELLRSLVSPEVVRGNWWGGYVGSHGARAGALNLWKQLLSGAVNTNLFYAAIGSEGLFATDLSFADYFEHMLPELHEISGGIGQLVAASQIMDDGIAIHWSQANEHAATLFSALGSPTQSQGNLMGLLDRCGFGYRFMTTRMIESGDLLKKHYRVLFLSCSQAISDKEAQAIREFAQAGGVVIADVATGIMDGHCKPLWRPSGSTTAGEWKGQLDELLGVSRRGEPQSKQSTTNLTTSLGDQSLSLTDSTFRLDGSVSALKAAQQLDGVPVLATNQVGQGNTIFLNFPFPNSESEQSLKFTKALLDAVGMKPACELLNGKGYLFRRFSNGDTTLIGVVRDSDNAADATLRLAHPEYVYDVRAGELLGKVSSIPINKEGRRVRLFSLLSGPTKRLSVQTGRKIHRGQAVPLKVNLNAGGVGVAGRIVRMQVFGPGKVEMEHYRSYITLNVSEASASVPLALNDPVGKWTITVTDVATGVTGKVKFEVE